MLEKFEVTNYRGFKDTLVFDLSSKDYTFNDQCVKDGIVTKALVYGRNGSGKSSLGLALFDLTSHLIDAKNPWSLVQPIGYKNLDGDSDVISFKYYFDFGKRKVVYEYKKNSSFALIMEKLTVDGEVAIYFENNKPDKLIVNVEGCENLDLNKIKETKISVVKYVFANTIQSDDSILGQLMHFVNGMLWFRSLNQDNQALGPMSSSDYLDDIVIRNDKLEGLQNFLKDNGVDLHLKKSISSTGQNQILVDFKNGSIPLVNIASSGTIYLWLFYCWEIIFSGVSFLFIDEFDAFYHYESSEYVYKILCKFHNMQVVVTTHNTGLLSNEISRPDACYLINGSTIKQLCDCTDKEIRLGHNLEKMYKNGAFHA